MSARALSFALLLVAAIAAPALGARCPNPQAPAALGIDLSQQAHCDPLVPERCLLPLPNDYYTVRDGESRTDRRVHFTPEALPKNLAGTPMDAVELNRNDGFSPGSAVLLWFPTADLERSAAPSITDIDRSLERGSPVVVVDAVTGKPWPVWAEPDVNSPPENRALVLRAAVNFREGRRYIVAVRRLVDASGRMLPASPAFASYRDATCTTDATFEARRPHMEKLFAVLWRAGVRRDDLQLAFDFTVASGRNIADRLLTIRDDAFRELGHRAPSFTVTSVQENPAAEFRRRIRGTFEVPLYLTGDGGPGQRFALDARGLPARRPGTLTATFTCNLPHAAATTPARMVVYGHGLLGDQGEVNGSLVRPISATYNFAYCATDFIGMAEEDIGNAVAILQDLSKFASLVDRLQQGLLNNLFLARLMRHPDGFPGHPAFHIDGAPALDRDELYYDGNSQGAILGGALCAVARDFRRCVLGEAGMNYSFLLQRSVDFDLYELILDQSYPDPFVQLVALNLIQMLWDRGETNGYAQHLTRDPYPRTPRHEVLLLGAVGDHQVSEFALQIEARTMGVPAYMPLAAPDRQHGGERDYGLTPIRSYPWRRSAFFLWDTGAELSPLDNVPPRIGHDPHDDTPKIEEVKALKSGFMRPDGVIVDVCEGAQCTGPQF
jgi:hypothetical protein